MVWTGTQAYKTYACESANRWWGGSPSTHFLPECLLKFLYHHLATDCVSIHIAKFEVNTMYVPIRKISLPHFLPVIWQSVSQTCLRKATVKQNNEATMSENKALHFHCNAVHYMTPPQIPFIRISWSFKRLMRSWLVFQLCKLARTRMAGISHKSHVQETVLCNMLRLLSRFCKYEKHNAWISGQWKNTCSITCAGTSDNR